MYTEDARKMFHSNMRVCIEKKVKKLREILSSKKEGDEKLLREMLNAFLEIETFLWLVEGMSSKEIGSYFEDPEYLFLPHNAETVGLYHEMVKKKSDELGWSENIFVKK